MVRGKLGSVGDDELLEIWGCLPDGGASSHTRCVSSEGYLGSYVLVAGLAYAEERQQTPP